MTHQDGATALTLAAKRGHLEVVRVLTEWGATVDTQDNVGKQGTVNGLALWFRSYYNMQ